MLCISIHPHDGVLLLLQYRDPAAVLARFNSSSSSSSLTTNPSQSSGFNATFAQRLEPGSGAKRAPERARSVLLSLQQLRPNGVTNKRPFPSLRPHDALLVVLVVV